MPGDRGALAALLSLSAVNSRALNDCHGSDWLLLCSFMVGCQHVLLGSNVKLPCQEITGSAPWRIQRIVKAGECSVRRDAAKDKTIGGPIRIGFDSYSCRYLSFLRGSSSDHLSKLTVRFLASNLLSFFVLSSRFLPFAASCVIAIKPQVFDCSNQVDRLVDESDCATLRLAYQMCFVNGKPLVCHECVQARTKYEQCLAMHVLPLVANKE